MSKKSIQKIILLLTAAFVFASCSYVMDDFKKSGSSIDTSGVTTSSETQSSEKQLLSFGFTTSANSALSVDVVGTVDQSTYTVAVIVPYATVTALVATFTCSDKASVTVGSTAQTSGTTANDFTNAVTYTVTAENGTAQTYAVTVTVDLFCEKIWYLSSGTDGSAETTGSYVWFGVWPQTIIASSGVTVYESTTTTMGGATYYKGSDGYWYAKVKAKTGYDDYTFTNGTEVTSGTEYYFKVEPIKWRVLESGKLLAESILANVCYYGSTLDRTLGSTTIYANNYNYSNIRAWLNSTKNQFVTDGGTGGTDDVDWTNKGFLQTAFTEAAQASIMTTAVDNSGASTTDATGTLIKADGTDIGFPTNYTCVNTNDKIYLLSELEVTNSATFGEYDVEDTRRRRTVSDYARAKGAQMYTSGGVLQYRGWLWLRSPNNDDSYYAHDVYYSGMAYDGSSVIEKEGGVVPALTLAP